MTGAVSAVVANHSWLRISDSTTEFPQLQSTDSLPLLIVESPLCRAVIAIQGAQLLSHVPVNGEPLLWLSPAAIFAAGKPVRGGVPLCLPWFGPHSSDADKPQHGFARNEDWLLSNAQTGSDGSVELSWEFARYADQPHPLFPWCFTAQLIMKLGTGIELDLQVSNCDSNPMPLSWALHSYHPVSDLDALRVRGLAGCDYLDNTLYLQRFRQQQDIRFQGEFDRIYLTVPSEQLIATEPALAIQGEGCDSAIVWNPGPQKAATLADIGADHWRDFICLERGNAATNAITLQAGECHQSSVRIMLVKEHD